MGLAHSPSVVMNGLVAYLDAGNPKGFDYDENLMTNSQLGNTILNDGSGVTLTTDTSIINPFGVYDGVLKCVHTTNTPGYFRRGQNMSLTAGVTYTFSFFFKNGTVVSPYGQSPIYIGVLASTYSPTFQELSQSLNTTISFPDGWYRQVFTFTPGYTQTYQIDFNQANNQTPIGTYYLYGFQLERGSSANPYYATTASAKNRGTTLIDMTGGGNTGTLTNGPTYNSSNGGSIVFDGTNDYVQKSSATINLSAGVTMEMIFKSTDMNSRAQGFMQFNTGGNYINFYTPGNGRLRWETWVPVGVAGGAYTTPTALSNNTWYHAVGTYSNGSSVLYINGNSVASASQTPGTYSSSYTGNIVIGEYAGYMSGNIAIAKIYNTALTAAEIRQNFNALRGRFGI